MRFSLGNFTADELAKTIVDVAKDGSSYKSRIAAASRIYRRQRPAQERAADAVEEVLRGDSHFYYPYNSYELSAWQYHHVDLLLVLFVGVQVLISMCVLCMWCCCCRSKTRDMKCKTQ